MHIPLVKDDEVIGVIVRTHDVTERHAAEDGLRAIEERYGLLFRSMREGCAYCRMLYDAEGKPVDFVYLAVNPAFERLTGLADVSGKRVTEVIPTIRTETPELFETYGAVARTGEPAEFDIDFTPLGMWLHVAAFRPEPDHFVAVFTNVSDVRLAEQELHDSEARYRGYFEQPLIGAAVDLTGQGLDRGQSGRLRLAGYTRDELMRLTWEELTHPDDVATDIARFDRVMAGETDGYRLEKRFVRKDGRIVDVDLSVQRRRTPDGAVDYFLALLMDITARKRAESVQTRSWRAPAAAPGTSRSSRPWRGTWRRAWTWSTSASTASKGTASRPDTSPCGATTTSRTTSRTPSRTPPAARSRVRGSAAIPASVLPARSLATRCCRICDAESYVGTTLFGHAGEPIGLIAVIGREPSGGPRASPRRRWQLVALRAAGELERLDAEARAARGARADLDMAQRASGVGIWDWDVVTGAIDWSDSDVRAVRPRRGDDAGRSFADLERGPPPRRP